MRALRHSLTERARRARAAAFAARFASDEATVRDWAALTEWLEADPRNGEAMDRLAQFSDVGAAAVTPPRRLWRPWRLAGAPLAGWVSAAALAAGAVLLIVAAPPRTSPSAASDATAITYSARTSPLHLTLADGTQVWLNRRSGLIVRFDRHLRLVSMAPDSEAVFDIAPGQPRPFVVQVNDRRVTDVGTAFSVTSSEDGLRVAVSRGVVSVGGRAAPSVRLAAGQMLIHRVDQGSDRVSRIDPSLVGAWRQGRLVYQGAPLQTVARELSRYLDRPLVVAPSARALRFTGVLTIDSPLQAVKRLEVFMPVAVEVQPDRIVLSARGPRP